MRLFRKNQLLLEWVRGKVNYLGEFAQLSEVEFFMKFPRLAVNLRINYRFLLLN